MADTIIIRVADFESHLELRSHGPEAGVAAGPDGTTGAITGTFTLRVAGRDSEPVHFAPGPVGTAVSAIRADTGSPWTLDRLPATAFAFDPPLQFGDDAGPRLNASAVALEAGRFGPHRTFAAVRDVAATLVPGELPEQGTLRFPAAREAGRDRTARLRTAGHPASGRGDAHFLAPHGLDPEQVGAHIGSFDDLFVGRDAAMHVAVRRARFGQFVFPVPPLDPDAAVSRGRRSAPALPAAAYLPTPSETRRPMLLAARAGGLAVASRGRAGADPARRGPGARPPADAAWIDAPWAIGEDDLDPAVDGPEDATRGGTRSTRSSGISGINLQAVHFDRDGIRTGPIDAGEVALHEVPEAPDAAGVRFMHLADRVGVRIELQGEARESTRLTYAEPPTSRNVPAAADPRDRHRGLLVPGLQSTRSAAPRLDATRLEIGRSTRTDRAHERFAFRAGDEDGARSGPASRLRPKPDWRTGARRLDLPMAGITCRVDDAAATASPIAVDTAAPPAHRLRLREVVLVGQPVGAAATAGDGTRRRSRRDGGAPATRAADDEAYADWELVAPVEEFAFADGPDGLRPQDPEWIDRFAPRVQSHQLLGSPGSVIRFGDGGGSRRGAAQTKLEIKEPGSKDLLAYSAFVAALGYKAVDAIVNDDEQTLPSTDIKLAFADLRTPSGVTVLSRAQDDLRLVLDAGTPEGALALREWLDVTTQGDGSTAGARQAVWPIAAALAARLWSQPTGGQRTYADQIVSGPMGGAIDPPRVGFDLSGRSTLDPGSLGWTSFAEAARLDPDLWPRARGGASGDGAAGETSDAGPAGATRDPSDPRWRGVVFRNFPVRIVPSPGIQAEVDKWPMLQAVIDALAAQLYLDYAWISDTGSTWKASLVRGRDTELVPAPLSRVVRVVLKEVSLKGSGGTPRLGQGVLEVTLPFIKRTGADGVVKPLAFTATFRIRLEGGIGFDPVDLVPNDPVQAAFEFPGFEAVQPRRLRTDFRSIDADIRLVPDPDLLAALPFLGPHVDARIAFDTSGDVPSFIELVFDSERPTNVFGIWPVTVQSARMELGGDAIAAIEFRGQLDLGLPAFSKIGATIRVAWENGRPTVGFTIDEISGSLELGGMRAELAVSWGEPDAPPPALEGLAGRPADLGQDLRGALRISKGDVVRPEAGADSFSLGLRIGSVGDLAYWIAAVRLPKFALGGVGSLDEGAIVLAHNADFPNPDGSGASSGLAAWLADVGRPASELAATFPPEEAEALHDWLGQWEPSERVGLFVAASGLLDLQAGILSKPGADDRTLIAFTDAGLVRIDAAAKLFGLEDAIRFAIFIDIPERLLKARIDLPEIPYPNDKAPEFTISGGRLMFGAGLKDRVYFMLSIGWPELIEGSDYERDWDTSVKILWDSVIPINTFWGGLQVELDVDTSDGSGTFFIGFALRAGWTKSYSIGGGVAKGSAELGIAVGGVIGFEVAWDQSRRRGPSGGTRGGSGPRMIGAGIDHGPGEALAEARTLLDGLDPGDQPGLRSRPAGDPWQAPGTREHVLAMFDEIEQCLATRTRSAELGGFATMYADIWGKASAELFGVTLLAVDISGRARFHMCFQGAQVTQCMAEVGFELKVTILCVTFSASCSITVWLKRGECPSLRRSRGAARLPAAAPAALIEGAAS